MLSVIKEKGCSSGALRNTFYSSDQQTVSSKYLFESSQNNCSYAFNTNRRSNECTLNATCPISASSNTDIMFSFPSDRWPNRTITCKYWIIYNFMQHDYRKEAGLTGFYLNFVSTAVRAPLHRTHFDILIQPPTACFSFTLASVPFPNIYVSIPHIQFYVLFEWINDRIAHGDEWVLCALHMPALQL